MPNASPRDLPFTRLGDYDVLAPISEGGMATVYVGRSPRAPDRPVALKVIRQELTRDKQFVAMLLDEAKIASRLSHPNIVAVHELGHDGTRHFLAMELLHGRTLLELSHAASARKMRIPYAVVAWIGARVADGLHHAHELCDEHGVPQNVVHRDVNPANILLTYEGTPKVIDFGLAKARDRVAQTAVGVVKGKLAYLSPEQAQGKPADRRSDIFALGVTLWETALGRRLFKADDAVETVRRARAAEVPDPRTIAEDFPPALADALARALAREPGARFPTARDFAAALDAFVASSRAKVDASNVRELLADLFGAEEPPEWERALATDVDGGRMRAWDEDKQKMTWVAAQVEIAPAPVASRPNVTEVPSRSLGEQMDAEIADRIAALDAEKDALAAARLHLERAMVSELLGDGSRTAKYAEASLAAATTTAGHALARRALHVRGAEKELLRHLDAEIAACTTDAARAALLAERARLLDASSAAPDVVRDAWERALAVAPKYPAAMKGLEASLDRDDTRADLAEHLARMADAWMDEPKLAAALLVERGRVLDRALGETEAARAAFAKALELDGGVGPARDAAVEHAATHRDAERFVTLLTREAELEGDPARAARLELDAAIVAHAVLDHDERATLLLERAAARVGLTPLVERRMLDELVRLYDRRGRHEDVARVLRRRVERTADPAQRAHLLRSIASIEEALGRVSAAVAELGRARALAPNDATIAEEIDRLLDAEGDAGARVTLWAEQAARAADDAERARLFVRAARLASSDVARATELARAALVARPANAEAVDLLTRLLTTPRTEAGAAEARARIAVLAHAADHERDLARRVAHLEAIALLEEEMLGDAALAAGTYDAILRLEPGRRGALVGMARASARAGDTARLLRALLDEAQLASDAAAADALRVRAAEVLAATDGERALALVTDVLARDPSNADARSIEQRVHAAARRWSKVDASLAARMEHVRGPRDEIALWLARAELATSKLRAPKDALAHLRAAHAVDPKDATVRAAIASAVEALGDSRALRDALEELAASETGGERALLLARAAEIDELALKDDAHAAVLYARAVESAGGDAWLESRRARVETRLAHGTATATLPATADDGSAFALRAQERDARATGDVPRLASALARQADAWRAPAPRLASLWAELALVEWKLPPTDATDLVARILRDAPTDRTALDAMLRYASPRARQGDVEARARVLGALAGLLAHATDDTESALGTSALAMALEASGSDPRETLARYRDALRIDPTSVVAALGTARLGRATGDAEAQIAGAMARATLTTTEKRRSSFLTEAAQKLLGATDALGPRPERLARACELLERALEADADAVSAAALLVTARLEEGNRDRLLAALRGALERATDTEAIVALGAETARVATLDPPDRVLAIDALRRVRKASPQHAPTLRSLATLSAAHGAWPDAADALEALAGTARDPGARLDALFELASIYGGALAKTADAERVLRAALDVDPANVRALRALVAARRTANAEPAEIAALLERLADAEPAVDAKTNAWLELATLREATGDATATEAALVEATALAPHLALARLLRVHERAPAEQARALLTAVARAQTLGRPDAATLATLGQLEVDALGRHADAVTHLRAALAMAPALHEARAALARALVGARAADASATLAPFFGPDPGPLVSLRDPGSAVATLEKAFALEGKREEAIVARELLALAGTLDDGAHVELRARRLPADGAPPLVVFDPTTLHGHVVPPEARTALLQLASAVGSEEKLVRVDLGELGISARDRVPAGSGDPVSIAVTRVARMFGMERPELVVSEDVPTARVVVQGTPWILIPQTMTILPEPVQLAEITRMVARVALGVPWLLTMSAVEAHALLFAAVRVAVPEAPSAADATQETRIEDELPRVSRILGRKAKKAIAALAPHVASATVGHVDALRWALLRAEARAAFSVTGDLLATLDALRGSDAELSRATANVGRDALAAVLAHPVAGDVARFALGATATALRWRTGALWTERRPR